MSTPASHVWKPSCARSVTIDSFVPGPRGSSTIAPPMLNWPTKDPGDTLEHNPTAPIRNVFSRRGGV